MSSEHFKILKEINSLSQKEAEHNQEIQKEEKRLHNLTEMRSTRTSELDSLTDNKIQLEAEILQQENELAKLQKDLERDKINLSSITTNESLNNLENQIKDKEGKIEVLEELAFTQLEKVDELEADIQTAKEFLAGSLETLKEIEKEVESETKDLNDEVKKVKNRILLLLEEVPPNFKSLYERVMTKNIKTSVFTRIKNGSCEFCRFQVSSNDKINIEDNLQLKTCSSCSRIFIPEQAFY